MFQHGSILVLMLCMVMSWNKKHSMKKFGNTSANTAHLAPHVLLAPYQVDEE